MTVEREVKSGYLVERTFTRMYLEFGRPANHDQVVYSIPRQGVPPMVSPKRYRGIARNPLQAWFHELAGAPGVAIPEEREAAAELRALDDAGRSIDDFILTADDVKRVWEKLRAPTTWEVVWAADSSAGVTAPTDTVLLGFEPTWFTGDHFSALADCMCFPVWHGTDEAGQQFAEHHDRLNEHALFPTRQEAEVFLRHYRSLDWTETGDYVIAELRLPAEEHTRAKGPVA